MRKRKRNRNAVPSWKHTNQSLEEQTAELESRRGLEQRLQGLQNSSTQFQQRAKDLDKIQTELDALTSRLSESGVQPERTDTFGYPCNA